MLVLSALPLSSFKPWLALEQLLECHGATRRLRGHLNTQQLGKPLRSLLLAWENTKRGGEVEGFAVQPATYPDHRAAGKHLS